MEVISFYVMISPCFSLSFHSVPIRETLGLQYVEMFTLTYRAFVLLSYFFVNCF